MVIFAWSSLQATVTDHRIREVVMRLAARHMGQAMELVPLVAGNGLGICAVDGGRSGVMNQWRGEWRGGWVLVLCDLQACSSG